MSKVLLVDRAPGETRVGLFDSHDNALALYVERASERQTRALAGAKYHARVKSVEPGLNAAFVDLGIGAPGFMPLGKARKDDRVFEGAAICARVRREAFAEKGPLLVLEEVAKNSTDTPCPSLLAPAPDFLTRINTQDAEVREANREVRETLDAIFDEALSPHVILPGGGELMIEQTRALVAIDVDTAADKSRALDVNIQAIPIIFRQLSLRGLAGIIAIDFAPMKGAKERKKLETALTQAVSAQHGRMEIAPLNRFGVAVLTMQRNQRPISETMLDKAGKPSTETIALAALRSVENEHRANPAKALVLHAAPAIIDWLNNHKVFWTEPLLSRLGGRLTWEAKPDLAPDKFEVIAP